MDTAALIAAIEAAKANDYDRIGLRVHWSDDGLAPGVAVPASRRWDDGVPTDEMLNGTSAIDAADPRALRLIDCYVGDRISVIAGFNASHGEDDCEIVIRDAVCVATMVLA